MRRSILAAFVIALLVSATLPVLAQIGLPPGGTFTDDDGSVHEGFIEAIAAEGVTLGCDPPANTRFCPTDTVTRAQMAAFLVRALDLPPAPDAGFDDVADRSTFAEDIDRLAQAGVTRGCNPPDNDLFCPDDPVTRGQMAAFLTRGFEYTDAGPGDLFDDDDGSVFEADIDRLAVAGVTRGCNPPDNTRYCPLDPVTREQMASFLGRAMGLVPNVPPPPSSTSSSSSSSSTSTTIDGTTSTSDDGGEDETEFIEARPTSQFVPDTVTIDEGESVQFDNAGGNHNVVWDDGAPGSGPPSTAAWTHTRTFEDAGTYAFFCQIHDGIGMNGEVVVTD